MTCAYSSTAGGDMDCPEPSAWCIADNPDPQTDDYTSVCDQHLIPMMQEIDDLCGTPQRFYVNRGDCPLGAREEADG